MNTVRTSPRVDTQITFKVSQPIAKALRERGSVAGVSCHAAARAVLEETLSKTDDERLVVELCRQVDSLESSLAERLTRLTELTSERFDALEMQLNAWDAALEPLAHRMSELRGDIRTGVCGILVGNGMPVEAAEAWVEKHIPRSP